MAFDFLVKDAQVLCKYPDMNRQPREVIIEDVLTGTHSQSRILVKTKDYPNWLDAAWFLPLGK